MSSNSMVFDTLAHAKKLRQVGFSEAQSNMQAEALGDLVNQLATKDDLLKMEERLEMRLIFKLTCIIVVIVGVFSGLLGIFIKLIH
jgi:hypothetical protein